MNGFLVKGEKIQINWWRKR